MSEAYKIGVTVALTNLVSTELAKIIQGMKGAEASLSGLKMGLVALGGTAVIGAIAGVSAALKAGVEEARKFQTEVSRFQLYGLGPKLNSDAIDFAKNMKIAGVSMTENMRYVNEAQGVFRESGKSGPEALDGAKIAAPILAKLDYINKSLYGDERHTESLALLRFIDMMGGNKSAQRFSELADVAFKLKTTSGGQVDYEALRQFRSHAMTAGFNLSDQLFAELEPVIGEMKGSTSGTALRTAYNRAHGIIKLPNQAIDALVKMGAWDANQFDRNQNGGIRKMRGDPLVDAALYDSNFIEWYRKHVQAYYDTQGFTPEQRIRTNALAFGSTGGSMMSTIDRQGTVITASAEAFKKALGINEAKNVADANAGGKTSRLAAEWADLLKHLGDEVLPSVNYGLRVLTGTLKWINSLFVKKSELETADANPWTAKNLAISHIQATGVGWWDALSKWATEGNGQSIQGNAYRMTRMDSAEKNSDEMPFAPSFAEKGRQPFVNNVSVFLDGRKVGQSLSDHMNRPSTGFSGFDGGQSFVPVH